MSQPNPPDYPGEERREQRRINPDNRLAVSINGDSVRIADLSCGGITLHGPVFSPGTRVHVDLHLGKYHLSVPVEILRTGDSLSHGQFVYLLNADEAALREYVDEIAGPGGETTA